MIAEFAGCDQHVLSDNRKIASVLSTSARLIDTLIVSQFFHRFHPNGVIGCVMLPQSDATIHTWPDAAYASVDLYTTHDCDPHCAQMALAEGLRAKQSQILILDRGQPAREKVSVRGHRRVVSYTLDCHENRLPDGVSVGKSPGRGLGLFVTRNFAVGEVIYNAPATLTEWDAEYIVETDLGRSIHSADTLGYELHLPLVEAWPEQLRKTLAKHYDLNDLSSSAIIGRVTDGGEREVLITGFDGLVNHSESPNTLMSWSDATVEFNQDGNPIWMVPTRAIRPIGAGEELFTDYRASLFDFTPPIDWLT